MVRMRVKAPTKSSDELDHRDAVGVGVDARCGPTTIACRSRRPRPRRPSPPRRRSGETASSEPSAGARLPEDRGDEVRADAVERVHRERQRGDEPDVGPGRPLRPGRRLGRTEEQLGRQPARRGCPPRAPALHRWAGTSTSSAGYWSNSAKRFSRAMPAMVLTRAAASRIGSDSRTMRRSSSSRLRGRDHDDRDRRPPTARCRGGRDEVDADQAGGQPQRRQGEHVAERRHERGGDVVEVPARSGPRRRSAASVAASTTIDAEHAADDRDHGQVEHADGALEPERRRRRPWRPRASQAERPSGEDAGGQHVLAEHGVAPERQAERAGVDRGARSGCRTRRRCCRAGRWRPGTSTSSPGTRSKVAVIDPSTAPATRLVALFSPRAARLCRALGPRVLRRRSTNRPMPEVWSDRRSRPGDAPDATRGPVLG